VPQCDDDVGSFVFSNYMLNVPIKYTMFADSREGMPSNPLYTKSMPLKVLLPDMSAKCDVQAGANWVGRWSNEIRILVQEGTIMPDSQEEQIQEIIRYNTEKYGQPKESRFGSLKVLRFTSDSHRLNLYMTKDGKTWSAACLKVGPTEPSCYGHIYGYTGLYVQYEFRESDIDKWQELHTEIGAFFAEHLTEIQVEQ